MHAASTLGAQVVVACPKDYEPAPMPGYACSVTQDAKKAMANADVVYTDAWTSMGQESESKKRLKDFEDYAVTQTLINEAKKDAIFMHCMPIHYGEEVDEDVAKGPQSVIYDQAENRLHAQKAIIDWCFS